MTTTTLKLNANAQTMPRTAKVARRTSSLRRTFTQSLELTGVLTLMGSCAAYALFTLAHLA